MKQCLLCLMGLTIELVITERSGRSGMINPDNLEIQVASLMLDDSFCFSLTFCLSLIYCLHLINVCLTLMHTLWVQ